MENNNFNPVEKPKTNILPKTFIPATISESIKICPENEGKLMLIETEESPSLGSDLNYILETSKINIFEKISNKFRKTINFNKEVKTEYFLTYHEKKQENTENEQKKKEKKTYQFIGDEILQIIKFNSGFRKNKRFVLSITDFEVGGTRYSKDFLQYEGFIPLERFVGKNKPKWIIIGAGPTASIQEVYNNNTKEKFLIIPGKINFRILDQFGLIEYKYKLFSSTEFLQNHPKIRKMAREYNVETTILIAEKILVLERVDSSWKDIWRIFYKSLKKHKDIGLTITSSFIYNFGGGIQQGAIINPILSLMDNFGILVFLMWLMQYIYPNFVYTISVILSADRFDKIKVAEKNEIVEKATISIELKKILLRSGIYLIISSVLLLLIYPPLLIKNFLAFFFIEYIIAGVYILSCFFRDWPVTFEQDAFFRILKRSLINDKQLSNSILKINAFAYSGSILFNLLGILIGWLAMYFNPLFGIILTIIGVIISFSKLFYPYYGNDYKISISTNVLPFFGNDKEVVIIPSAVSIRSNNPIKLHSKKNKIIIYDDFDFEILLLNNDFEPEIKKKMHIFLSSIYRSWILKWKNNNEKINIKIILKNKKTDFELEKYREDGLTIYKPLFI